MVKVKSRKAKTQHSDACCGPCRRGGVSTRGESLAAALNDAIEAAVTEDTSRSDIIAEMGEAAGIAASTVNQILNASINCPPIDRIEGFAEVLGLDVDDLIAAAEEDGCDYSDNDDDDDDDAGTEERRVQAPVLHRSARVAPESFREDDLSFDVIWSTGATVRRFDFARWEMVDETLSMDPAHIRLERLNRGAPVLNSHDMYSLEHVIGSIVEGSVRVENGEGLARVRLSGTEDVEIIAAKVKAGHIRNVSVGYVVHTFQETINDGERAQLLAIDWEPWEVSLVAVPADPGAQIRAAAEPQDHHPCTILGRATAEQPHHQEERSMVKKTTTVTGQPGADDATPSRAAADPSVSEPPAGPAPGQQTPAAETVTVASIRQACRNAGLDADATFEVIERHDQTPLSNDALMAEIGRRFAERDTPAPTSSRISVTRDEAETRRSAMTDAVLHRMSPSYELTEPARDYRGMNLLRLAEETLQREGVATRGMAGVEIAERALHSTSDFPNILSNVLNKRLRMAYEESQPTYRVWARRAPNAPDFKQIDVMQMSSLPDLLKVNEAGEIKYGTASDGKISYSVLTYGRIIGVTRQTLINDDLRALDRLTTGFAGAAARLENRTVYAQLTGNNTLGGSALFSAGKGNLAGAGATISATTLSAGRAAMRKQKGLQKEELNIAPRFLLVPTDLEQTAYQFTSSQFVPAKATDVNEFRAGGRTAVEPIVEPVLDGSSASAWYLAADTGQVDTIEYAFLEGSEGVQLSSRVGFSVDGVEFKAVLDFAAAAIDHRGLYKNPGA